MNSDAYPRLKRARLAQLWRTVERERALISLFYLGRRTSRSLRAARVYAFGVFATYALAIALTGGSDREPVIRGFVRAALVALSWVVGALAALGTAQVLANRAEHKGLTSLALQWGFGERAVLIARTLAAAKHTALLLGVPALLLVGVAALRGAGAAWASRAGPSIALYACALGLAFALMAILSSELAPRHPRAALAALVLAPLFISQAWTAVPSIPGLFGTWLGQILNDSAVLP